LRKFYSLTSFDDDKDKQQSRFVPRILDVYHNNILYGDNDDDNYSLATIDEVPLINPTSTLAGGVLIHPLVAHLLSSIL